MKIQLSDFDIGENAQINEISKEFFPKRIVKKGKNWICPICYRPYHKEPGPFTCGIKIRENERAVSLWVRALDCCGWEQHFSLDQKVEISNMNTVLKRIFSSK